MTLAALIILDDERPTAPVLGLSWPEFQLRRAVRAGALHLVLVTDRVGRDVVEAVDRLRGEGLSTTLARSTAEVADLFHPDEAVLLMTGGAVVADARLKGLLVEPKPALLCIEAERAEAGHELIDARSHWTGFARLDGAHIRATAAMPGDWDLGSMLLRKAVAARVKRIVLAENDLLADAATPAGAVAVARALVSAQTESARGWGARWIVGPVARLAVRRLPAILPPLARFGSLAALALLATAPLLQFRQWTTAALSVFLVALVVATTARLAAAATGIKGSGERLVTPVRDVAAVATLSLMAASAWPDLAPIVLGVAIASVAAMADRLSGIEGGGNADWLADIAGHATILLVASVFGPIGLLTGLAICAIHGLASLAILQNRLSRVLTSLR